MIVTCPNCGARYRLSDAVVARGSRLRCAACDHRWVPETEADEFLVPRESAMQDTIPRVFAGDAPLQVVPPPPEPPVVAADDNDADDDDDSPSRSPLLRTVVAVIIGLALAIAAAGLWAGQIDASRLPVIGPALAGLAPPPSPLKVTVTGAALALPSGGRMLEVTGTISNPGRQVEQVPVLKASLSGPGGAVRHWMIAPPVTRLAPGESATFASTVTGFPGDARTLSVTPGR